MIDMWQDRLKEAAYKSPSGKRIIFDYENVSKSIDKKTSAYDFPDASGTYVQDLGHTGRKYPLRCIFWGDDHDLSAELFEAALIETGIGTLEHPLYGSINVVPFGSINFRNDLKTAANQTIIDVTFWETIKLVYPVQESDPASAVIIAVKEATDSIAGALDENVDQPKVVEQTSFKNNFQRLLDTAKAGLQTIADAQDDVKKQFDSVYRSINDSIDILVATPLNLAFQTTILLQSPARALQAIQGRLDAYKNLADTILGNADETPGNNKISNNRFFANELYASTYVTGSILSVVNNQFVTKTQALEAAEFVLVQMDDLTVWRDNNYASLGEVDTGEMYQQLQEAVAITAGFLVEISFTLKQERTIVLEKAYTLIDLISLLYPADIIIDDEIDFFIASNELTGSEILELPKNRTISYYV